MERACIGQEDTGEPGLNRTLLGRFLIEETVKTSLFSGQCGLMKIEIETGFKLDHLRLFNQLKVRIPYVRHGKHVSRLATALLSMKQPAPNMYPKTPKDLHNENY